MRFFSDLKAGTRKIMTGFGVVAVLTAAIGAACDVHMRMLDQRDAILYGRTTDTMHYLGSASEAYQRMVTWDQSLQRTGPDNMMTSTADEYRQAYASIQQDLQRYAASLSDSTAIASVNGFTTACRRYVDEADYYDRLISNGQLLRARHYRRDVLDAGREAAGRDFQTMMSASIGELKSIRNESTDILDAIRSMTLIIFGTGMTVALGLGLYVSFSVGRLSRKKTSAPIVPEDPTPAPLPQTFERSGSLSTQPAWSGTDECEPDSMFRVLGPIATDSPKTVNDVHAVKPAPTISRIVKESKRGKTKPLPMPQVKKSMLVFDDTVLSHGADMMECR